MVKTLLKDVIIFINKIKIKKYILTFIYILKSYNKNIC